MGNCQGNDCQGNGKEAYCSIPLTIIPLTWLLRIPGLDSGSAHAPAELLRFRPVLNPKFEIQPGKMPV